MRAKILFRFVLVLTIVLAACSKEDNTPLNSTPKFEEQSFEVSEDFPAGQTIGVLEATDPDGDPLSFKIYKNDNDLFRVSSDGTLSLADDKNLDYETAVQHTIIVTVGDGDRQTDTKIIIDVINVIDTMAEEPESFVTHWKISNQNDIITIGTNAAYEYSYLIDWGDGTFETNLTDQNPSHKYAEKGIYQVIIQGEFPALNMGNTDIVSQEALVSMDKWGSMEWQTMENAFMGCVKMIYKATDVPNLTSVKNLTNMFADAKVLNASLNDWDVSGILKMDGTFSGAVNFNGDIGKWDVGNVTDMSNMFHNASSFNGDISKWDVASVKSMNGMFSSAIKFNVDLSDWTVDNVTDMTQMFSNAIEFNANIGGWNVENVSSMFGMFVDAFAFDRSLGNWNIAKGVILDKMLDGSGISRANYEATLIGWSDRADNAINTLDELNLGALGREYCSEDAILARNNLMANHGWTINGDSQQCN